MNPDKIIRGIDYQVIGTITWYNHTCSVHNCHEPIIKWFISKTIIFGRCNDPYHCKECQTGYGFYYPHLPCDAKEIIDPNIFIVMRS